ncbi:MAG: pseudouridine synthase [Kiritimatiellae bacterium]|nr:pseudouridine synthase [Kiritimatiellia bacterium]
MKSTAIRLQKFLAERGTSSRRKCAGIIQEGHITVNGTVVREPGFRVDPVIDVICRDGKQLGSIKERHRTIILYKPRGYICSTSDKDGRTIYELIKGIPERLVPVGRLDKNSEGLLLMSNDGNLTLKLTHPRFEHEKTYEGTVTGMVDGHVLQKLRSRMLIDGYRIQPAKVNLLRKNTATGRIVLQFVLKEGRNQQIRKMCDQAGLEIHRLVRTKIGNMGISGLKPGQWHDCEISL